MRNVVVCSLLCVFHVDCLIFVVRSASRDLVTSPAGILNVAFMFALFVSIVVSDDALRKTDSIVAVREADRCTGNISTRVR